MSTAFYVRVSSAAQVQSQTIEQQLERLRAYGAARGLPWDERRLFRDDGYSGATLARPGLDRLRDEVALAAYDRVVVTAPDRLARKYAHQALLVEEFEQRGCRVEFVDQPAAESPHDQLVLQIRGAVAEYERALIAERLRRGRQHRYRAGTLLPWTTAPYGYALDPDRPRAPEGVRVDPAAAALIRELVARYLEPGQSVAGLAKELTAAGVPSPAGRPRWTAAGLRRLLRNPAFTGRVYAGQTRARPVGPRRSPLAPVGRHPRGSRAAPPEEWILVGHIPPLVTQEQFDRVQAKLATNGRFARRNNRAHPYLLRALVSCGRCRLHCQGQTRHRYQYYVCAGRAHPVLSCRPERCPSRLIPVRLLDAAVWADLCALLQEPERVAAALQRARGGAWLPQELQARREVLRKGDASLAQQVERLTQAYLEQVLSLAEYGRRRRDLEARRAALAQQARELEAQATRRIDVAQAVRHVEAFCRRVSTGLEAATFEQQRQLVELLVDRVVVTDEDIEIRYVVPTSPAGERTRFAHLRLDYSSRVPCGRGIGTACAVFELLTRD
jgi:site-specific DNA recombinase